MKNGQRIAGQSTRRRSWCGQNEAANTSTEQAGWWGYVPAKPLNPCLSRRPSGSEDTPLTAALRSNLHLP